MSGLYLGVCIFIAYSIEAITGFGSIVIALSLAGLVLPFEVLLPVLVPLNILMSGYLSWKYREHIDKTLLLKTIFPMMVTGTLAGVILRPLLSGDWLKVAFGALVLWFAVRELWRMQTGHEPSAHRPATTQGLIVGAGLTHGLFASGGPLLVYGLSGLALDKTVFRATLISVWFTLNSLLTLVFLFQGQLHTHAGQLVLYIPVVIAGVWLGEKVHHRVNEQFFRRAVFTLLGITGVALLLN